MPRSIARALALLLFAVVGAACTESPERGAEPDRRDWTAVFQRGYLSDELGDPVSSRHWIGGDGGVSVALPGGGVAWIFGDSQVGDQDPVTGFKTDLTFFPVFGNTIGYLPEAQAPNPEAEIAFFARATHAPQLQPPLEKLDVVDITGPSPDIGAFLAFFHPEVLGIPEGGAGGPDILWPAGAICLDCEGGAPADPRLLLGFTRVEFLPMAGRLPILVLGSHLVEVANPSAGPTAWTATELTIEGPLASLDWGKSFVRRGDDLLIYGSDADGNVHVARAPVRAVFDLAQWEALVEGGAWVGFEEAIPDELALVASGVGAIFTIDEITHDGVTRFVLVHAHPVGDHMLFVRSSEDPTRWGHLDATTPRLDLVSVDPALEAAALKADGFVACSDGTTTCADPILECDLTPVNGLVDLDECALSYHGLAHPEISELDRHGEIENLAVSYVLPSPDLSDPEADSTLDHYVPRFAFVPLTALAPWCPPASRDCWRGINHRYAKQRVAPGESRTYLFDLSDGAADEFVAELDPHGGSPSLRVSIEDDAGVLPSRCSWEGRGRRRVCVIDVPPAARRARVTVSAAREGASFDLRTSYDGGRGVFD